MEHLFNFLTPLQNCGKRLLAYSNIYIQQDATLHNLFYLETALHVLGGTSTYHQELSRKSWNCYAVPTLTR